MEEIIPGVFLHQDQVREALHAQGKGTAVVPVLMNALFSKETMRNATLSSTGKEEQLDEEIVQAILCNILTSNS